MKLCYKYKRKKKKKKTDKNDNQLMTSCVLNAFFYVWLNVNGWPDRVVNLQHNIIVKTLEAYAFNTKN